MKRRILSVVASTLVALQLCTLAPQAPQAQALSLALPTWNPSLAQLQIGGMECTGALIAPDWILTARHCIGGEPHSAITVGTAHLGTPRHATDVIMHPNADLAVVKLNAAVPAPLAQLGTFHVGDNTAAGAQGFGAALLLPRQAPATVQRRVHNVAMASGGRADTGPLLEAHLAYGRLVGGDSGSPLLVGNSVVGIASMANTTSSGTIGWYTPVAEYSDWISRHTGIPYGPITGAPAPLHDDALEPAVVTPALSLTSS